MILNAIVTATALMFVVDVGKAVAATVTPPTSQIDATLLATCAPTVDPSTMRRVIAVESGGNPLAININGGKLPRVPRDAVEAAQIAQTYIKAGYSVDLGLMQVNSRNLPALGYTVMEMFDPCNNLNAGATVLTNFYNGAKNAVNPNSQIALVSALSAYNTGDYRRGIENGYVARYFGASPKRSPPIVLTRTPPGGGDLARVEPGAPNPFTASTVVYIRKENPTMKETTQPVVSRSEADANAPGVQVEHTADQADANGAFRERAISEADAWESNAELGRNATGIVVNGKPIAAARGRP